jgi:hypothetical protein
MEDWLKELLSKPTASVQNTAKALGFGKNVAYDAVKRGDIPTIDIGADKKTVPTAWIRRKLEIDGE